MSRYLIRSIRQDQLGVRVKDLASRRGHNIIKFYCQNRVVPPLPVMCSPVLSGEERPPVEREHSIMPNWLRKSLLSIHRAVIQSCSKVTSTTKTFSLVFPKGTKYPQFLPKGVHLSLHPARNTSPPPLPKPRPLGGFSCPTLVPLAKAPPCPTGNLLPNVSTPTHSLFLLAPSTSMNGVLPLVHPPSTPAHGMVPQNTSFPINFQYITPELGSAIPMHPPANVPPTLVQIPPSVSSSLHTTVMVRTSGVQRGRNMTDKLKKMTIPKRFAPLKPAPQLPKIMPLPSTTMSNARNSVVVMEQAIPLNVTQNIAAQTNENPCLVTAAQRLVTSQDIIIQLSDCNVLHTTPIQNTVENGQMSLQSRVPPACSQIYSPLTAAPADSSQYMLVPTVTQTGVPQFLLMPKDSLVVNQPAAISAECATVVPQHHVSFKISSGPVLNNSKRAEQPLNIVTQVPISVVGDGKQVSEEELEAKMTGDRWEEEMAGALFGSPLLTPSESSRSLDSSLNSTDASMDSGAEASVSKEMYTKRLSDSEKQKRDESDSWEPPGLLKHSTGDGKDQQSKGGENEGNMEEGRGEESESGGVGERDEDKDGEKSGDGESSEKRDGDGGGDKGREERDGDGDGEKDGDGERDEEEEDFDDLTQDEDEEEVMSSASEESVLSVPELQETMEKLTWLASERRLCQEGDSEEDNSPMSPTSPTSPNSQNSPASQNSQEENSEDEEDGVMKGDEMEAGEGEGEGGKLPEGDAPPGDDPPQSSGRGGGRGRGRGRPPPRSLKRGRRQERGSKDASKLLLLYDDHILDNDPMRESKDMAFAQSYLNRVREALQDVPGKVEEFLGLLYEFDQAGDSQSVVELFSQLKPLLRDWPDLLKDFAAFLLPEQALECGLFEEQQAFDRSRRFLRQLEISFGENPSHYQKIVRALQTGTALSPAGIDELKAQMATLLKGHTHLQGEFWMFFDEMRPPPARPGQFEEAVWLDDVATGIDGEGCLVVGSGGGVWGGFEEVTLPDLEEDDESHKIRQISGRSKRRKEMLTHGNYKECDWPEKDCLCPCHDSSHDTKHRRHKRKGCLRCHSNKGTNSSKVLKSRNSAFLSADLQAERGAEEKEDERGPEEDGEAEKEVKDEAGSGANSPCHDGDGTVWEEGERIPSPIPKEQEKQNEEDDENQEEHHIQTSQRPSNEEDASTETGERDLSTLSPAIDTPVCAKNISLTASGERVILWTREADRVILTACQQQGANQSTFQAVSEQLGNKTASEVSTRFRDLMRLFHTSACQVSSEDEATEQQSATDEEQD